MLDDAKGLTTGNMVAYGAVNMPLAMAGTPLALLVPQFYSGDLGLNAAVVGGLILLARVTDVITDPIIGMLSDRTRSRFGRRKSFIAVGLPFFVLAFWFLLVPGSSSSYFELGFWIVFFYIAFTLIGLPYGAWGAELTDSYTTRTRMFGIREGFGQLGIITVSLIPFVATGWFGVEGNRDVLQILAIVVSVLCVFLVLPALLYLPERPVMEAVPHSEEPNSEKQGGYRFREVFRNGPFVRVFITFTVFLLSLGMLVSLAIPWMRNVVGLSESQAWGFMLMEGVIGVAAVPIWVVLANRYTKHRMLCVSFLGAATTAVIGSILIHNVDAGYLAGIAFAVVAFTGVWSGAASVLPSAMAPDTVDLDTLRSGHERAGMYYAVIGMGLKLAIGVGIALGAVAVSLIGFDMKPGSAAAPGIAPWVTFITLVLPALINLLTLPLMWNFPLGADRHATVARALERRRSRVAASVIQ